MHFGVHFPKENVQQRVHFTKSNVQHHIFQRKMFSITFDFVKCSASHFTKSNVMLCKNAFDALQKYIFASHFVTQNVTNAFDALQKYIFASHFVLRCKNAFWRTFSKGKCSAVQKCIFASHFPKENVQLCKNAFLHHIFQRKMFSCAKMHLMQKCI